MFLNLFVIIYYYIIKSVVRLKIINPQKVVLNYHQIGYEAFNLHLNILINEGFTLSHLSSILEGKYGKDKQVHITFDDGYYSIFSELREIILKREVPLTVYVCSNKVESKDIFWWDYIKMLISKDNLGYKYSNNLYELLKEKMNSLSYKKRNLLLLKLSKKFNLRNELKIPKEYRLMSWKEVVFFSDLGVNFGSHTHNHINFTVEQDSTIKKEILKSKTMISEKIGKEVVDFAYPNGEFTSSSERLLNQCGFKTSVVVDYCHLDNSFNPYKVSRMPIAAVDDKYRFFIKLYGFWPSFIYKKLSNNI